MVSPLAATALAANPITAGPFAVASMFGGGGGRDKNADFAQRQASSYQPGNPYWQQQGAQNDAKTAAYDGFYKAFGRAPNSDEMAQILPSYLGGDPNITNTSAGDAAVAGMHIAQTNTPEAIAAQQQSDALAKYKANQGDVDAHTNQIFQQSLGRNANADEASHFGALLASGQIDQYGMNQLLGQSQEAQQRQTQQYQSQLANNLQSTQGDYFKNYINPSILSQTAAAGRDPNSSGVQQAEVQAGKQQNYDLQNYLAQFGAGQYGQSAQNQQNVYQQYLGQQYGLQNAGISQQLGQQAYMQQQNTNLQNYQLQQQAYNNYLRQYGNRNNGLGSLLGGVAGAAIGGFGSGTPQGAQAGFNIGSGIGSGLQGVTSGGRQGTYAPF